MTQGRVPIERCAVCGANEWRRSLAIGPDLAAEWDLSPQEVEDVDRAQGAVCVGCGCQLRVSALALAIGAHYGWRFPLRFLRGRRPWLRILEMNRAGNLTESIGGYPRHRLAEYPDVDMQALPYPDASFDLVLHSDTLEHVADPVAGLRECRRVLAPGGALAYTVPVIPGRMSRRRGPDEPTSHHGGIGTTEFPVVTEYGADMWTEPFEAGFRDVRLLGFDWPAGLALVCRK